MRDIDATKLQRHADTWIAPDAGGAVYPDYRPTFPYRGDFIDATQARYAQDTASGLIDLGIPGWLRPADALKLYEMAYFARGPVLEIGAYHGLSTSILTHALRNAGRGQSMVSLELDAPAMAEAKRNLGERADLCEFILGDARASCAALKQAGRVFDFAFVDHSHAYDLVRDACADLKTLLRPGGFALFHDYNDGRNGRDPDYGVYQAVVDSFADGSFEFYGAYGCTGLYRRAEAVAQATSGGGSPMARARRWLGL